MPYLESLLCVLAIAGLVASLAGDFQRVRTIDYVATDYKTLYASAALFRQGANPYSVLDSVEVYRQAGVVLPRSMFGHMPVYPPVTLLALWPLTYLSMGRSAVVWLGISALVSAGALAAVLAEARRQRLHWSLRLGLVAFAAGAPVLGYALDIGNVSPVVGALTTIALLIAVRGSTGADRLLRWRMAIAGASLGLALCLKPHSAVWVLAGIVLVCGRMGRGIAWVAGGVFALGNAMALGILWARGMVGPVVGGLVAMLLRESRSGSMSPASREMLPAMAQITGLNSLLGLWLHPPIRNLLAGVVLLGLLWSLLRTARCRPSTEWDRPWQILFVSALFSAGMLASYHRVHDDVMLPGVLGLWLVHAIRTSGSDGVRTARRWVYGAGAGAAVVLLGAGWIDVPVRVAETTGGWLHSPVVRDLLALRQGALLAAGLAGALVILVVITRPQEKKTARIFRSVPGGQ